MKFFKRKPNYQPKITDIQTPIITINSLGQILFSNSAANNLFEANNLKDKNVTDIIKSDLPAIISGSSNSVRKAFETETKESKYVEITSRENHIEGYFVLAFQDVTKDYILMNKLIEYRTNMDNLGKNKNMFLAQMANVFKSPMHSVMGYSQAILEGMGGETDEKQQKYLSIIYKQSEELFKILDKVTELSKIEAQMTDFTYQNYHVLNLLNDINTEYSPKCSAKGLQFKINIDNLKQKVVYGNENVLKKVISYLLENAMLSCEFGTINLILSDREFVEKGQNLIKIKVIDTSTPVNSADITNLFNPYYQPDKKNRTTLIKSLNLCIAGNLTAQMNGKMSAETEVSGFTVIIPSDKNIEVSRIQ